MKGVLRDLRMEGSSISMETGPLCVVGDHCGPGGGPIPIGKAQLFMGEEGASSTTP